MARLYADENFPQPVVVELRRLGHDVLTTRDTGRAGISTPDEAILALAAADGRAVLSLNRRHFVRLHGTRPDHAGIIACTFDPDFVGQAGRIHAAIATQAQLAGRLIRVNRPGAGRADADVGAAPHPAPKLKAT
jgi:hypothetical protein